MAITKVLSAMTDNSFLFGKHSFLAFYICSAQTSSCCFTMQRSPQKYLNWAPQKNKLPVAVIRGSVQGPRSSRFTFLAISLSSSMSAISLPDAPPILVPITMLPTIVAAGPGSEG